MIDAIELAIKPALKLLGARFDSPEARVMLLAIGLQESKFKHRTQVGGPARSFWQFERGGGVTGVINHPSSSRYISKACDDLCYYSCTPNAIYEAMAHNDVLAAVMARLLLWTDARPLPDIGDEMGAWDYYNRNWRPGKPHPEFWPAHYAKACKLAGVSD